MAGTVTALKAQRSKDRVNVYLDGEFAFGLALIHALWLKIGQKLSDEDIEQLKAADTLEKAQQKAVNFIAYRPRTAREVRLRLKKAGADEETVNSVLERLTGAGMLDDEAFGKAWVESRLRSNPRSKRMLAWELRQKGVGEREVEAALEGVNDEEAAFRAAQKRWPRVQSLEPRERKRKLMEFLARNGFDYQTIESVIARVESTDDGDEFQALDD
jgi:regulatory protein